MLPTLMWIYETWLSKLLAYTRRDFSRLNRRDRESWVKILVDRKRSLARLDKHGSSVMLRGVNDDLSRKELSNWMFRFILSADLNRHRGVTKYRIPGIYYTYIITFIDVSNDPSFRHETRQLRNWIKKHGVRIAFLSLSSWEFLILRLDSDV